MTDAELAALIIETHDRLKPPSWVRGEAGDDNPETRFMPRVLAHWTNVVREVRHQLEADRREQTAATIFAALMRVRSPQSEREWRLVHEEAVALADALRAELAKGPR